MRRAVTHHPAGTWPASECVETITLPCHERHRRRFRLTDDNGQPFLLDLPNVVRMADGDGLALENEGFIRVRAAAEGVVDLFARSPAHLATLAWHIGNRHVPIQIVDDATLRVLDEPILVAMAVGLGAKAYRHLAPFSPESGAHEFVVHDHPPILVQRRTKAIGHDDD